MKALIGQAVFVRTVTYHYTGLLAAADEQWLTLVRAAWIADSGRWTQALETGSLSEVEPYPAGAVYLAAGSVVDITAWPHDLPREQR